MARPPVVKKPAAQHVVARSQTLVHHGPLPDPQTLANYEDLCPGSWDRIFSMTKADQQHRIDQERAELQANIDHRSALLGLQESNSKNVFRSDMAGQIIGGMVALFTASR